jgi:hypothetical protein
VDDLSSLILLLLRKSPLFLVLIGGLIFAVIRWKRHRRTSLLASIGISVYLLSILVVSSTYYVVPGLLERMHISMATQVFTVIQIIDDLVYSGVLILLIGAAFSERPSKSVISA